MFPDCVFLFKNCSFFHVFLHWSNSRRLLLNTSPRRSTQCCLNSNLSSRNSGGCWSATAKREQSKVELRQQVAPIVVTRFGLDTRTWLMCSTHLEQLAFQRLSGCRTGVSFPTYCTWGERYTYTCAVKHLSHVASLWQQHKSPLESGLCFRCKRMMWCSLPRLWPLTPLWWTCSWRCRLELRSSSSPLWSRRCPDDWLACCLTITRRQSSK